MEDEARGTRRRASAATSVQMEKERDSKKNKAEEDTAAAAPSAKGEGKGKQKTEKEQKQKEAVAKKKKEVDFRSGQRRFLTILIKQMMQTTQITSQLFSVLMEVFVISADPVEATSAKEQTVAYSKKVVEEPDKQLGPPHLWAFSGLLKAISERPESEVGEANSRKLKEWQEEWKGMPTEARYEVCRHCRVDKMYAATKKRLTIFVQHPSSEALQKALLQLGAEKKMGPQPAGYMERELQEYLLALE